MNDLWIVPQMKGGYSAVMVYECLDFYVSLGKLNSYAHASKFSDPRVILFVFKLFDITLIGSYEECDTWKAVWNPERGMTGEKEELIKKHVFRVLLSSLDAHWLKWIIDDSYNRGCKAGRNDIRRKLAATLQEEY